jgi:hypothetical protein
MSHASKSIAVLGLLLLSIVGSGRADGTASASEIDPQKQFSDLAESLANGSVASIDILHMPDLVETRVSVAPANLESWFGSRVTINKVGQWSGREELVEIMKSSAVTRKSQMPDLRSAVIFYASDGHRIGTLYLGRYFGRYLGQFGGAAGAVGDTPVSFKGNLPTWLKRMIPSPLQ